MKKVITILIWFVVTILIANLGLHLLSASSTVLNVVGLTLLVIMLAVSVKTRLFTTIHINFKKHKQ